MSIQSEELTSETSIQNLAALSDDLPILLELHSPSSPGTQGQSVQQSLESALSSSPPSSARLARINADTFPVVAQQLRVSYLPTVLALFRRRVVDSLVGPPSHSDVLNFVRRTLALPDAQPGSSEEHQNQQQSGIESPETLLEWAKDALANSRRDEAIELLMRILRSNEDIGDLNSGKARALLGRAQVTPPGGLDVDEAREQLNHAKNNIGWGNTMPSEVTALEAALDLMARAQEDAEESAALGDSELEARAESGSGASQDALLSALRSLALRRYANGERDAAFDWALKVVKKNREWREQEGRKLCVLMLDSAQNQSAEEVKRGRNRLSSVWFL